MPTVVSATRRQRRPRAIESLTEPPLESSTIVAPPSCRPREFIEIPWTVGGHDADRADPAPAIRLASRLSSNWQFAFFERECRHAPHRPA
jgi:hypothetical protein